MAIEPTQATQGKFGPEHHAVGFGAWAIGGTGYDFAWGKQDDADSIAAIHRGSNGIAAPLHCR